MDVGDHILQKARLDYHKDGGVQQNEGVWRKRQSAFMKEISCEKIDGHSEKKQCNSCEIPVSKDWVK